MTNAVTISAPATGTVGQGLAITGAVVPATDTVSIMLSQQNSTLPTGPFVSATTSNGAFAGVLTPVTAGTWYAWVWDQATGLSAVSGAITVPNAALLAVLAVPISAEQVASLLGGSAAGETPDELPAAAAASGTDTFLVAQGGKNILAQPLTALWTWIQAQIPSYLQPQINVSGNINLTNSAHNGRFLLVTATGVTITALIASLGPGFECTVFNNSGSTVAVSGIILSNGGSTIAAGARVLLTGWNIGGTVTIYGDPL